jgi:transcriptional regulator with XRE-family HTH domain
MPSSDLKIEKRRRTYVRLIGQIHHALNDALREEHERRGLTQTGMAEALDMSKSFVSRKMNGTSNMTLETLADLAFALDRAVSVNLRARTAPAGTNIFKPTNEAAITILQASPVTADIVVKRTAAASTSVATKIRELAHS